MTKEMKKEYTIYSMWLAYELRRQDFKLLRVEINPHHPQYECWVFENSAELQYAIRYLAEERKKKQMKNR